MRPGARLLGTILFCYLAYAILSASIKWLYRTFKAFQALKSKETTKAAHFKRNKAKTTLRDSVYQLLYALFCIGFYYFLFVGMPYLKRIGKLHYVGYPLCFIVGALLLFCFGTNLWHLIEYWIDLWKERHKRK